MPSPSTSYVIKFVICPLLLTMVEMSLVQLDFMEKYPHQIARLHAVGESL